MGATQSSPIGVRHKDYNHLNQRESLPYSANFGAVRFRSNYHQTSKSNKSLSKNSRASVENNNDTIKQHERSTSYGASNNNSKRNRSILASSWNFAKRTVSAMPFLLNSNRSSLSISSKNSELNKHASSTFNVHNSGASSSRQLSASSSHDSNVSSNHHVNHHIQPIKPQEKTQKKLDDLNCNSLKTYSTWKLADKQSTKVSYNDPITYACNKSSQDSLNFYAYHIGHKHYDEQDLTNNNTITQSSPQRMPNFINSLDQFANRIQLKHSRGNKLEKNHSSLSNNSSEFSSNTTSTESTSSFSAYDVANLNVQTKQLYHEDYTEEDEEEEEMPKSNQNHINSLLRISYSQQSFLSPSDSFDNGVNGNVFGRNVIMSSSTADLLRGLGRYVSQNSQVSNFEPANLVMWLRSIDRALMIQGWQDIAFVTAANLVFVYLLIREQLAREYEKIRSLNELQSLVCCCLYVSYSYLGNEISYPLKPFISQHENRSKFWNRCLQLINLHSDDMLRLNQSTDFFLELFGELQSFADLERC